MSADWYRLQQLLGTGSFSQVWKAIYRGDVPVEDSSAAGAQHLIPKQFAVKIFRTHKESIALQRMIQSEIEIHRRLMHPNIARFFETHETHRGIAIALEIGEAGSLYTFVRKQRKLAEGTLRIIFAQIVAAILYMHRNKVANRDLKLENVLFFEVPQHEAPPVYKSLPAPFDVNAKNSTVTMLKVIDFGLAADLRDGKTVVVPDEHDTKLAAMHDTGVDAKPRHISSDDSAAKTENHTLTNTITGRTSRTLAPEASSGSSRRSTSEPPAGERWLSLVCGSLMYTAPEIIEGKAYQGRPVDIWSAGVLLYACAVGSFPFSGKSEEEVKRKILSGHFELPGWLSTGLQSLIRCMLAPDPAVRATIEEVAAHAWLDDPICRQFFTEEYLTFVERAAASTGKPTLAGGVAGASPSVETQSSPAKTAKSRSRSVAATPVVANKRVARNVSCAPVAPQVDRATAKVEPEGRPRPVTAAESPVIVDRNAVKSPLPARSTSPRPTSVAGSGSNGEPTVAHSHSPRPAVVTPQTRPVLVGARKQAADISARTLIGARNPQEVHSPPQLRVDASASPGSTRVPQSPSMRGRSRESSVAVLTGSASNKTAGTSMTSSPAVAVKQPPRLNVPPSRPTSARSVSPASVVSISSARTPASRSSAILLPSGAVPNKAVITTITSSPAVAVKQPPRLNVPPSRPTSARSVSPATNTVITAITSPAVAKQPPRLNVPPSRPTSGRSVSPASVVSVSSTRTPASHGSTVTASLRDSKVGVDTATSPIKVIRGGSPSLRGRMPTATAEPVRPLKLDIDAEHTSKDVRHVGQPGDVIRSVVAVRSAELKDSSSIPPDGVHSALPARSAQQIASAASEPYSRGPVVALRNKVLSIGTGTIPAPRAIAASSAFVSGLPKRDVAATPASSAAVTRGRQGPSAASHGPIATTSRSSSSVTQGLSYSSSTSPRKSLAPPATPSQRRIIAGRGSVIAPVDPSSQGPILRSSASTGVIPAIRSRAPSQSTATAPRASSPRLAERTSAAWHGAARYLPNAKKPPVPVQAKRSVVDPAHKFTGPALVPSDSAVHDSLRKLYAELGVHDAAAVKPKSSLRLHDRNDAAAAYL